MKIMGRMLTFCEFHNRDPNIMWRLVIALRGVCVWILSVVIIVMVLNAWNAMLAAKIMR